MLSCVISVINTLQLYSCEKHAYPTGLEPGRDLDY